MFVLYIIMYVKDVYILSDVIKIACVVYIFKVKY